MKNKKNILIGAVIVLLIAVGAFFGIRTVNTKNEKAKAQAIIDNTVKDIEDTVSDFDNLESKDEKVSAYKDFQGKYTEEDSEVVYTTYSDAIKHMDEYFENYYNEKLEEIKEEIKETESNPESLDKKSEQRERLVELTQEIENDGIIQNDQIVEDVNTTIAEVSQDIDLIISQHIEEMIQQYLLDDGPHSVEEVEAAVEALNVIYQDLQLDDSIPEYIDEKYINDIDEHIIAYLTEIDEILADDKAQAEKDLELARQKEEEDRKKAEEDKKKKRKRRKKQHNNRLKIQLLQKILLLLKHQNLAIQAKMIDLDMQRLTVETAEA